MGHIFVTSTAQANQNGTGFHSANHHAGKVRQGMGCFQGGDDALGPGQEMKGFQSLVIPNRYVLGPPRIPEMGMFRPDSGIVQPRRNRMGWGHLPIPVL